MTTILINDKPVRFHATLVTRVQAMVERGMTAEAIAAKIARNVTVTAELVSTIKGNAQLEQVA